MLFFCVFPISNFQFFQFSNFFSFEKTQHNIQNHLFGFFAFFSQKLASLEARWSTETNFIVIIIFWFLS